MSPEDGNRECEPASDLYPFAGPTSLGSEIRWESASSPIDGSEEGKSEAQQRIDLTNSVGIRGPRLESFRPREDGVAS